MENNINIYIDIFKEIRLKSEAQKLSEQIDAFLVSIFQIKDKSNEAILREIFGEKIAEIFINNIKNVNLTEVNANVYQTYLNNLIKIIDETKVLQLTLSIEADRELVRIMSDKLRESLSTPTLLIELKTNPGIMGGAEMILNGKYLNLSLEKRIDGLSSEFKSELQ